MSILNFKLLGGIVVVATAGMLLACQPNPKANRSALHCVEPTWDIGTVKVKPELLSLSHEFVLTNRSKSLVEIVEIRSTCGFLSVSADEKILPGSELRLRTFVKVLPISGKFRHQILVRWRGLKDGETHLHVTGTVEREGAFFVIPKTLNFGTVIAGDQAERSLELVGWANSLASEAKIQVEPDVITCQQQVLVYDAQRLRLRLLFDSRGLEGYISGTVFVETMGGKGAGISVPFKAIVSPAPESFPSSKEGLSPFEDGSIGSETK